jgi:hypothetical protein
MSAWTAFEDMVNVPLYVRDRIEIRIIDVLLSVEWSLSSLAVLLTAGWQAQRPARRRYAVVTRWRADGARLIGFVRHELYAVDDNHQHDAVRNG